MSDHTHKLLTDFDTILYVVIGLALAEIHLLLSIVVITITGFYNAYKFIDYLKKRKYEKIKNKTENHFNDDDIID